MQEKPLYFYMANLWSEVEKIFIWRERGDERAVAGAFNRMLPIIEKVKNSGDKNARAEISILEEALLDIKDSKNESKISRAQMSSYLRPFAARILPV